MDRFAGDAVLVSLVEEKGSSCGKSRGRSNRLFGCIVHEVCFRPQHTNPSTWYISLPWNNRLQLGSHPQHDSTHIGSSVWVRVIFRSFDLNFELAASCNVRGRDGRWAQSPDQTKLILLILPSGIKFEGQYGSLLPLSVARPIAFNSMLFRSLRCLRLYALSLALRHWPQGPAKAVVCSHRDRWKLADHVAPARRGA